MKPKNDRETLVLIDASVTFHSIEEGMLASMGGYSAEYVEAMFSWLTSLEWLRGLPGIDIETATPVFALDYPVVTTEKTEAGSTIITKKYWRTEWLAQDSITEQLPPAKKATKKRAAIPATAIQYKGGRGYPTDSFTKVKTQLMKLIEASRYASLQMRGYEADDIIAGLTVLNEQREVPYQMVIATIDSDLIGLVNENVGWYSLTVYRPRVRFTLEHINQWASMKRYPTFSQPSDIWAHKALTGDSSDKIPGTADRICLPAIDLLNPPIEHRLWLVPYFIEKANAVLVSNPVKPDGNVVEAALRQYGVQMYPKRYSRLDG